jgi:hypothetical protein
MCVQEEERFKGSHGDSVNYVKQNKKRAIMTRMLNHKGNLSGTEAPLIRHMQEPHKRITILDRTIMKR